ncbi:MAG: sigma-70 family RNA polymerase sigma factor [Patescibacteria group bacterium]|jgi:RNA polymerase sigma-70 factor (ECF subfamily)
MVKNENKIIRQCQAGDLKQFAELYEAYIEKIYSFVFYRTMHREIAEDLVSQIFLKALERINSYDETRGAFSSWLYSIARNTVIDHYRTKRDHEDIDSQWSLAMDGDLYEQSADRHLLEKVIRHLNLLNTEQRDLLIMKIWDELTYKEIAEIIGKTPANCKMIFYRTIHKLRQELTLAIAIALLIILSKL